MYIIRGKIGKGDVMEKLICESCGASEFIDDGEHYTCSFCGSQYVKQKNKNADSSPGIALDEDISRLLSKCKTDPENAEKYANLVLDIDPSNSEAMKYIK